MSSSCSFCFCLMLDVTYKFKNIMFYKVPINISILFFVRTDTLRQLWIYLHRRVFNKTSQPSTQLCTQHREARLALGGPPPITAGSDRSSPAGYKKTAQPRPLHTTSRSWPELGGPRPITSGSDRSSPAGYNKTAQPKPLHTTSRSSLGAWRPSSHHSWK